MSETGKTFFAPLPLRAISDDRLAALDLRVLACLAFHDRMSSVRGKGQGAWASNETLAKRVGCHYTRLSSSITRLGKLGYVDREPHPLNKRLRVYRVRYDGAADSLPDGKALPTGKGSTPDNLTPPEGTLCDSANSNGSTVCRDLEISAQSQSDDPVEYISLSDVRDFAEANGRYSDESARLSSRASLSGHQDEFSTAVPDDEATGLGEGGHGPNVGAHLARLDRALKAGGDVDLVGWYRWIEPYVCDEDETIRGWAMRLSDEVAGMMTDDEFADWERGRGVEPAPSLRDQIAVCWHRIDIPARQAAARAVGLKPSDVRAFFEGKASLPYDTQAALQTAMGVVA